MNDFGWDDLNEEEKREIFNSEFFQKGIKYRRLADGLQVLKEEDHIYDRLVQGILSRQNRVESQKSVEDILDAFVEEVEHYVDVVEVGNEESEDTEDWGAV